MPKKRGYGKRKMGPSSSRSTKMATKKRKMSMPKKRRMMKSK